MELPELWRPNINDLLKSIQNVLWSFQSYGCGLRRLFQLDVSLSLHLGPLSRSSLREYQIPPKVSPLTFGVLEACSRMALNLPCVRTSGGSKFMFLNKNLNRMDCPSPRALEDRNRCFLNKILNMGGIWYSWRELRDSGPRCSDRFTSNWKRRCKPHLEIERIWRLVVAWKIQCHTWAGLESSKCEWRHFGRYLILTKRATR